MPLESQKEEYLFLLNLIIQSKTLGLPLIFLNLREFMTIFDSQ